MLVGAGHAHLEVLRYWSRQPLPDVELTCIAPHPVAAYSGMLPGVLAGQYTPEQMEVELAPLCARANARLHSHAFREMDIRRRTISCADGTHLPFDVLSFNVGSVPRLPELVDSPPGVIPVKPMTTFLQRLTDAVQRIRLRCQQSAPLRVAVLGGGVAATEVTLCLNAWLRRRTDVFDVHSTLIGGHSRLVPELPFGVASHLTHRLQSAGIRLNLGCPVVRIVDGNLEFANGEKQECDLVIVLTSAIGSPEIARLELEQDQRGFLLTNDCLQSVSHPHVFAAGDCGTQSGTQSAKAGVYSVRQAPILWHNLSSWLQGRPLRPENTPTNFSETNPTETNR